MRHWLYDFGGWIQRTFNRYPSHEDNDKNSEWWYLSFSFEGTEKDASDLTDEISNLLCGNPDCSHFGEFCRRQWVSGMRLRKDTDVMDVSYVNTNPISYTWTTNTTWGEAV